MADHFYRLWAEYDLESLLAQDWLETTLAFIADARARLEYAAFVAEVEGASIGSAACQVFSGLYPSVFQPDKRKYGYIWGVYVEPEARGKGIAKALTEACTKHLKAIGCTKIVLHASPMGRSVYGRLGFAPSNEMVLEL